MTGPSGRCKAFDAGANGFGRGEGCGVLMLKRLDDAIAHGDNILAVVCSKFTFSNFILFFYTHLCQYRCGC